LTRTFEILKPQAYGFDKVCAEQWELGRQVRAMMARKGREERGRGWLPKRLAWWSARKRPCGIPVEQKFLALGLRTAAGVPLRWSAMKVLTFSTFALACLAWTNCTTWRTVASPGACLDAVLEMEHGEEPLRAAA
jgi:hypothetical protein